MNQLITGGKSIKSRLGALFSSAGAMIGACGGICGSACVTGACGSLALPLFGFIGLSSATMLFLGKLKPIFLLITIMSLAYAFYKAYKPEPADCQENCRAEKQTFLQSKSFLWAVTIISSMMWLYPYVSDISNTLAVSDRSSQPPCSVPCDGQSPIK